jgi:small subunit ribosomal protein S17e
MIILEKYPDRFSEDFERNKEELEKIAIITSKQLKNEIAGYITRHIKKMKKVEKPEEVITS